MLLPYVRSRSQMFVNVRKHSFSFVEVRKSVRGNSFAFVFIAPVRVVIGRSFGRSFVRSVGRSLVVFVRVRSQMFVNACK